MLGDAFEVRIPQHCAKRTEGPPPNPRGSNDEFARRVERANARRDLRAVLATHRKSADAPPLPASTLRRQYAN